MKTLGIYTKNFSLYYDLLKALKKRNIAYVSLTSLKHVPSKVNVILTSHKELHDVKTPKVVAADAYENINDAIDIAVQMLIGKDIYSKIYIGIDPGEKPGIAVVGDDILLQKTSVEKPKDVLKKVKQMLKAYPARDALIRVGNGSPLIRNRIINSLITLEKPIEIVNESKTTSQEIHRNLRDKEAAAAIALLPGGRVQTRLPLEPKKGEIRRIQMKSRKLTNGRFSISQKTAKKVLKGEISLKEAIEQEEKKIEKTN